MTPDHYDDVGENVRRIPANSIDYTQPTNRTPAQKAQDDILDQAETAVAALAAALAEALAWTEIIEPAIAAKYEGQTVKAAQFATDLADLRRRRG